jgi:hypothetical protein
LKIKEIRIEKANEFGKCHGANPDWLVIVKDNGKFFAINMEDFSQHMVDKLENFLED